MLIVPGTDWSVKDARAYILARVEVDANGCWIWQRAKSSDGYGSIVKTRRGRYTRTFGAHRLAYMVFRGDPSGLNVCHACDVRSCCNPNHLWLGTQAENMGDAHAKRRMPIGSASVRALITEHDVVEVFRMKASGASHAEIRQRFGVSHTTVSQILTRKRWAHVHVDKGLMDEAREAKARRLRACAAAGSAQSAKLARLRRAERG